MERSEEELREGTAAGTPTPEAEVNGSPAPDRDPTEAGAEVGQAEDPAVTTQERTHDERVALALETRRRLASEGASGRSERKSPEPAADFPGRYDEYNKTLRTWFIAYGIGALALFITQPAQFAGFSSGKKLSIAILLLVASGLQILVALIGKYVNFYAALEIGARRPGGDPRLKKDPFKRPFERIGDHLWISAAADLVTIILFLIATAMLVIGLTQTTAPEPSSPPAGSPSAEAADSVQVGTNQPPPVIAPVQVRPQDTTGGDSAAM